MIGKIISLPSNGLSYSKFIRVFPIKFGSMILLDKAFFNANQSEYLEALLNEYTRGLDILEMYVADAIYVHNYLLATSMELEEFGTKKTCNHCDTVNLVKIKIADFEIKWLDSSAKEYLRIDNLFGDSAIYVRRRKVKDNFTTAMELIKKNKIQDLDYLIEFIIPQIFSISNNSRTIAINDGLTLELAREYFTMLQLNDKKRVYDEILKFEEEMGYENKFVLTCRECGKETPFFMWDYKSFSVFTPTEETNKSSQFENIINLVRSKTVRFSEFMEIPNIIVNDLIEGIQKAMSKDK